MVPAETAESGRAVRAVSLFVVLAIAKSLSIAGRDLPISWWAPVVFFWQDVAAALVFLAADTLLKRRVHGWLLYAAAVLYAAINVPVSLVLGSPLTWNMMRAAGGPLADSVRHHVTLFNVGSAVVVAGAGAVAPRLVKSWPPESKRAAVAASVMIAAAGMWADSRIDTRGLQRNAFGALMAPSIARASDVDVPPPIASATSTDAIDGPRHLRASASDRNVVLIVLESTAARYLGIYGAARDPMPALTGLSRHAVIFENAYAVYPESIKGLFSTLCSRYPAFNTPPEVHARVPCSSLAETLGAAGYRTALFHSGRFGYLGMAPMIEDSGFEVLRDAGAIGGEVQSSFGVDESSTVRAMLEWLDSLDPGERFLLTYLPIAGHHPYAAPAGPFEGEDEFNRYLNALHYGDLALGQLIEGIRARGLENNTLFVIHGDHGEAFGQHPDNVAHSLFIYDENIRVPFLIAAPGVIRDSIRIPRVASLIDVAPTILDLLGRPPAAGHQGVSLLASHSRPAFFYTDYSLGWLGFREGCLKYLYEIDAGRSKLFDICIDPDELRDLSLEFAPKIPEYRARVERWAAVQQDVVRRGR